MNFWITVSLRNFEFWIKTRIRTKVFVPGDVKYAAWDYLGPFNFAFILDNGADLKGIFSFFYRSGRQDKEIKFTSIPITGLVWYTCMREWKQASSLGSEWIMAVRGKLKSLLFHLLEYLFSEDLVQRQTIVRVISEDFSDVSQLIEELRRSQLPGKNLSVVFINVHWINDTTKDKKVMGCSGLVMMVRRKSLL